MIKLEEQLTRFINKAQLPQAYFSMIEQHWIPLADWLVQQKKTKPLLVGINGAQGTGKSTMAAVLQLILQSKGYKVAVLSLDDFYFSHNKRVALAEMIHPLLQTRGVPGTHDVALAISTVQQLISGQGEVSIPRFDKQTDNPKAKAVWDVCAAPVDIVLFEGWCVGTPAQTKSELQTPINDLEAIEDNQGIWRAYVNDKLEHEYQALFGLLDKLIFLQAPCFEAVFDWRYKQEQQTFADSVGQGMNEQQLRRFMAHYQRLTQQSLDKLPKIADVVLKLDKQQQIISSEYF